MITTIVYSMMTTRTRAKSTTTSKNIKKSPKNKQNKNVTMEYRITTNKPTTTIIYQWQEKTNNKNNKLYKQIKQHQKIGNKEP